MSKVSVIVPVYNVEQYLKKCVDSILNQTYLNLQIQHLLKFQIMM